MKYLITGGAGFIGSHLAEYLLEEGHHVAVIDDLSAGSLDNIRHLMDHERFNFSIGSILDFDRLEEHVHRCDAIFHLAAVVGVQLVIQRQVHTITTNVDGTENVLKLACRHDKKVLLASTSEVYGKLLEMNGTEKGLSEEDDWLLGQTAHSRWSYACTKALDEFLAFAYKKEHGLRMVIVRLFNTVGPRQTGHYGMVVPKFVEAALKGEPIRVFGDGEQTRCFLHVRDAVRIVNRLMELPEAEGELFNVGGEQVITINNLAERVRRLAKSDSEIVHVPYEEVYGPDFDDIRHRVPDISKLRALVDAEPRYTTDEILRDVIEERTGTAQAVAETESM